MAQLIIKRLSWWEGNAKQLILWGPIAAAQASTLAGLGYFYHRLNELEVQSAVPQQSLLAHTLQDVAPPTPTVRTSRIPLPLPPVPAPSPVVLLQVTMASPVTQDVMRVGQDFSIEEKPVVAKSKPAARKNKNTNTAKDLTAQANRSALRSLPAVEVNTVAIEPEPEVQVDVEPEIVPHRTAPVGVSKWVYLGELRDYGWYGQKLRISPDSGLPQEGGTYQTQQIHGLYDEPHGRRVMGGFQLGDTVTVQKVRQEANGGVWAEVRKVRSVGKPGCVRCTQ